MTVVADTNVVAYYLLGAEGFYTEAERFWEQVEGAFAPSHWQAEWANVVWLACRAGRLNTRDALDCVQRARRLPLETVPIPELWAGGLERSLAHGVAVYDTLFVELAVQRNCPLATFDRQILRAFPGIASRPRDLYPA